jgi:flagellar basal-body rod protein FlgG
MVKGLYTTWTSLVNQQNRMDIMTNNLANSATTGYKKEGTTTTTFADEMAIKIKDSSDYDIPTNLGAMSLGVRIGENYTDYGQGAFRVTDNVYDVALDGDGFFAISYTNKAGETSAKYTRDGSFTVTQDGYLVTKDGDYVLNQNGATNGDPGQGNFIRINPNEKAVIDEYGNIMQNDQLVGQLGIADVADYNFIAKFGENLYDFAEGAQVQPSNARVEQGALEMSNVSVVSEMVEMINITRLFESNQKIMNTIDGSLEKLVSIGKV